ncbi:hypothetical protein Dimus_024224 [Dionaea muscipula]
MYPFYNGAKGLCRTSLSYYINLIDRCFSLKSLNFAKTVHVQLIKVGLNGYTFLGNRCMDFYSRFGDDWGAVVVAFEEIRVKNTISWNVCLKGLVRFGEMEGACGLFDQMPQRDVVTWNTMISGYTWCGRQDDALNVFLDMQNCGVRPSGYTLSILASLVACAGHGKQIHGNMIRNGVLGLNVVLGNALIGMYGKLGLIDYAFGVFMSMEELDVISWNSMIWSFHVIGLGELALDQFFLMRSSGYSPDQFTISSIIAVCADLQDLEKGKQIFAFCIKKGFLSNTIVSSAAIDLFSQCNRLKDSICIFLGISCWDSAVCNSMMACFARHGLPDDTLYLFVHSLRKDVHPTEFTISTVISSITGLIPLMPGTQVHSLAVKLGFVSDAIVAGSLVEMYAKYGMIESSLSIFVDMDKKDLVCWNSMIYGLAKNGRAIEALHLFNEMLSLGEPPDHVTFTGVLSACKYSGLVYEGISIFSTMEKENGVLPRDEHYECIIDLLSRAGLLKEAMDVVGKMPHEPTASGWRSILFACKNDLELIENASDMLMEIEPHSSLPYLVLARAYEARGRWESMVWVKKSMEERGITIGTVAGCSWIVVNSRGFVFRSDELVHYGGDNIYLILRLLTSEMEDQQYINEQFQEED